jgi:hypothetical protein
MLLNCGPRIAQSMAGESGVDLMNRAEKKERAATRDFVRRSILDLPQPVSASRGQVRRSAQGR